MKTTTTEDEAKLEAERKYRREYMRRYLAKKRESPEFRAKEVARAQKRYAKLSADPEWKKKQNAKRMERFRARYASDPEYRAKLNEQGRLQRARYGQNWRRGYRLLKDYGISLKIFVEMHRAQGGACAICGRISDEWLHVDHEHVAGFWAMPATEKAKFVRGLLCKDCNNGIGKLGDDPARLRAAADYLETSKR